MATAAKQKRAKRITGVGKAAAALGVTRQHLGLVLHGDRISPKLRARYRAWRADQRARKKLLARAAVEVPKLNHAVQSAAQRAGLKEIARAATYLANRS